jgi:RNA polymerase sigma factor (TIGR02999 family)
MRTQHRRASAPGDRAATNARDGEALIAELYRELRSLAGRLMRRDRGATLQPTELIHEVYLKLSAHPGTVWTNREHFLAVACQAMRRVLVDHVRRRAALKRGRYPRMVTLSCAADIASDRIEDVLAVDELLARLGKWDARLAQLVELRYFGGLTTEEAATVIGISYDQARRDWTVARAWFKTELHKKA